MSTNAPPASARSTQESPAEAAAAARPSQGITQPSAIKEEPIAEGKAAGTDGSKGLTEGSRPVTEGNKALAEKKAASTVTPQGATGAASGTNTSATTAAEKRAAGATQPSSAAAQPAGAAKKQSGNAAFFLSVCTVIVCCTVAGSVQFADSLDVYLYDIDILQFLQHCIFLCDLQPFGDHGSFTLLYARSQTP